MVEALGDPLVHLVRNAVDHGLEAPAERTAAGKPPTGVLEISAEHAGGEVVIRVKRRRPRHRPREDRQGRRRARPDRRRRGGQPERRGRHRAALRAGLLDRLRDHRHLRPRRRHGRRPHDGAQPRRRLPRHVRDRQGLLRHDPPPALAGHPAGAARGGRRVGVRPAARPGGADHPGVRLQPALRRGRQGDRPARSHPAAARPGRHARARASATSSRRPPSSSTAGGSASASSSTSSSASRSSSPVRFPRSPMPSARSSRAAPCSGMAASP